MITSIKFLYVNGFTLIQFPTEVLVTPEQFAEQLCDDLELPASQFMAPVASQIRQQCEQFSSDLIPDDGDDRRVVIKVCLVTCVY